MNNMLLTCSFKIEWIDKNRYELTCCHSAKGHQGVVLKEMYHNKAYTPPRVQCRRTKWNRNVRKKKKSLQYLQINWHISFKTKSFSHVINHKNISSILKFWKLIHVIPTILKRSCLVLSYFEQDIKKCISSSISPELHCWYILDSGGVPLYIDLIQYGDDVMIFEILLGFSWTQILSSGETSKKDSFLFHKQF
jgi:hypothetical protein